MIEDLRRFEDFAEAIREMHVRGAPLIGSTAAYALYVALRHAPEDPSRLKGHLHSAAEQIKQTRPTAVNLAYAADRVV